MKEVRLVKPHRLSGRRVPRHGVANLAGSQPSLRTPFEFDSRRSAVALDVCSRMRLKRILPREVRPIAVITYVADVSLEKAVPDRRIDRVEHHSAIDNRRLAALLRWLLAEEADPHRPARGVRHFVVKRYALIGRIFRRRIDLAEDSRPRG